MAKKDRHPRHRQHAARPPQAGTADHGPAADLKKAIAQHKLGELDLATASLERARQAMPHDQETLILLARIYAEADRVALAVAACREFLQKFPDSAARKTVQEMVDYMAPEVARRLAIEGLPPGATEAAWLHERSQLLFSLNRVAEGTQAVTKLLELFPGFLRARNNLSLLQAESGRLDEALATVEQVLAQDPANLHATANQVRFLLMQGQPEEAAQAAQRLKTLRDGNPGDRVKRVEALSFLGDDRGVRDACATGPLDGQMAHYAAVAALRLGDEAKARRLWVESLKQHGPRDLVNENLQDLSRPPAERNGPWYQPMQAWLPMALIDELMGLLKGPKGEEQIQQAARTFLERHPGMPALGKILLERGDRTARQIVLHLANDSRAPELLAAVREFALGQQGADALRHEAAQIAIKGEALAPGEVRMWRGGQWQPTLLIAMEIYSEPVIRLPMHIAKMAGDGFQALRENDGPRAERILKQALALAPDAPDLWNNLAQAYRALGRLPEAEAILRRNYEEHPDYFFSPIGMAGLLLEAGRPSEAADMLVPLLAERRLHRSEFAALCGMEIQIALARGLVDSARSWLGVYRSALPDHHQFPLLEAKVAAHTGRSSSPRR